MPLSTDLVPRPQEVYRLIKYWGVLAGTVILSFFAWNRHPDAKNPADSPVFYKPINFLLHAQPRPCGPRYFFHRKMRSFSAARRLVVRPRDYCGDLRAIFVFIISVLLCAGTAWAIGDNLPIHSSADRQFWDRKNNRHELIGNAIVSQPGETLTADKIVVDMDTRTLVATGNCVYVGSGLVIKGEEMHFNLDTRTGTIIRGRVSNERFSLSGERINRLGPGRFQTHWGEYTTCKDCPRSWSFQGRDVDLEFDGYAFMSDVTGRIDDTPTFWLPYLIVPVKSRRQTGLLFPKIGTSSDNGTMFVLPFFWAINRSSDMTFGMGDYSKRGTRLEWEGRYQLSPRDSGKFDYFHLMDKSFGTGRDPLPPIHDQLGSTRWAMSGSQSQEFSFGVIEKLKIAEMSDNFYPSRISIAPGSGEDLLGTNEPVATTSFSLTYPAPETTAYMTFQRNRNLINTNADPVLQQLEFDPKTVQVFPKAEMTTNDKFIGDSPIATGMSVGIANFTRTAGGYDEDLLNHPNPGYNPGIDPLRKATRLSLTPSLYTTLRPWDIVSVIPSLQYHYYYYSFHNVQDVPNLSRGYLLFQTDLSTQLERIYTTDNPDVPRVKHLIRPTFTYSYIPPQTVHEPLDHPFLRQIEYGNANYQGGYNFDDNDIIPYHTNRNSTQQYFYPLGNSLAYGFTSQLIRRQGSDAKLYPSYIRTIDLSAGEALNFLNGPQDQLLTRFYSTLGLDLNGKLISNTTYYYYPYIASRNTVTTSASYVFERATHQRVLQYDRSVTVGYSYDRTCLESPNAGNCGTSSINVGGAFSLNDYFLPSANVAYNFIATQWASWTMSMKYQSPSQCWKVGLEVTYNQGPGGLGYFPDISLNLTGSGFGGLTEAYTSSQTASH